MATVGTSQTEERPRNYFKIHIALLKICGMSFSGNESIAYKLYSFVVLSSTVYAYTILVTYELFKHDFETSPGILIYQSISINAMIKTTIVLANRINFGKLLAKLEQEPFLPNPNRGGKEEEKLIRECIWKTHAQIYVYWTTLVGHVIIVGLYTLSMRYRSDDYNDWKLPYGIFTALNITYSPNYEIIWFYQCFSIFTIAGHFTTNALIISAVLAHTSYQFKILQNFIRHIVEYGHQEMLKDRISLAEKSVSDEINISTVPWKYLQKSIKDAVRYHVAIIDIAKEMEKFFRYLLLGTFLVTMGILCFELYQATFQRTALGLFRNVLEYGACAFEVLTICYWGEQVISENEKVGSAAYESNFVGSDLRFQKALVIIIRRSQYSPKLTAGKFADICLATFTWVMRTSYSFFMVIRNTYQNKI